MGSLDEQARGRLSQWRKARGLTQAAMAEQIGRNAVWISRYFDGAYDADLDTLSKMAGTLGYTLFELLDLHERPEEQVLINDFRALGPADQSLLARLLASWVKRSDEGPPGGAVSSVGRTPESGTRRGNRRRSS